MLRHETTSRWRPLTTLALIVATVPGCARMVDITAPGEGCLDQPVNSFVVELHPRYRAGTFTATLSDGNISVPYTGAFQPVAAPGGTTMLGPLAYEPRGEFALRVEGDNSPGRAFDVLSDTVRFRPAALELVVPPANRPPVIGGASSSGSGSGSGGGSTSVGTAPRPQNRDPCEPFLGEATMRENALMAVTVKMPLPPAAAQTIEIIPSSNAVSINGQPAGGIATVTVPSTDRETTFVVQGVVPNTVVDIYARAPGYQGALLTTRVNP
jgi:hypothetical protein